MTSFILYTKKGKKISFAEGIREYFNFQASRSLNRLSPPQLRELCRSLLTKQVHMLLVKSASAEILVLTNLLVVHYSQTPLGTESIVSLPSSSLQC